MTTTELLPTLQRIADSELLAELKRLAARERDATVHVIAALMEVEARRLHLGEGCPSLFVYCTDVLHFSEHAAYLRAVPSSVRTLPAPKAVEAPQHAALVVPAQKSDERVEAVPALAPAPPVVPTRPAVVTPARRISN